MNILFACPPDPNPFLENLRLAVQHAAKAKVHIGEKIFWKIDPGYQVVHLHWIESLVGWKLNQQNALRIQRRLREFKSGGARICLTRHNVKPHRQLANLDLYLPVLEELDGVIHMGRHSQVDFQDRYESESWFSRLKHVVIEHPSYSTTPNYLSREQSRQILGIGAEQKVILVMGAVRSKAEAGFCMDVLSRVRSGNVLFVCPRWRTDVVGIGARWKRKWIARPKGVESRIGTHFVKEEEMQLYLKSADVVLLPRLATSNLNSGIVPLAYTFGRVVVGPALGVIGDLLTGTGNPVFPPGNAVLAAQKIDDVLSMDRSSIERNNQEYANSTMSLSTVGAQHLQFYDDLLVGGGMSDQSSFPQ